MTKLQEILEELIRNTSDGDTGYAVSVNGKKFIPQAIQQIEGLVPSSEKVTKAIEILGRPVMSYVPEIAIKEYDTKIKEAVELLLACREEMLRRVR